MSSFACSACMATSGTLLGAKFGTDIFQCSNCCAVLADCPEPGPDFYSSHYFEGAECHAHGYVKVADVNPTDAALKRRLRMVGDGHLRVVDFGAGAGQFVKACEMNGLQALGVERSPEARRIAEHAFGVNLRPDTSSAKQWLGQDGEYVLTLWEVLEHSADPVALLDGLFMDMGRPCRVALSMPHGGYVAVAGLDWAQVKPPEHLVLYTAQAIASVASRVGYRIESVKLYQSHALNVALQRWGSRKNRRSVLWPLTGFMRLADPWLGKILPGKYFSGMEVSLVRLGDAR